MKKKMKKENTNAVPDYIDNSFCNIEDILKVIDNEGLRELDFNASDMDKILITRLGVQMTLKNRKGKDFKVFVCPDSYDDNKVREVIWDMGMNINKQMISPKTKH